MSTAQTIGYWSAVGFVLCGFCFVLVRKLLAAGYSLPVALEVGSISLAQPAYFEAGALRTALFSVVTFVVAWAAAALLQRQEPRRIVLLGSSLAGAQLLHPLCGAAATLVLPFALRQALARAGIRRGTGLYISLLFIPVLALMYWGVAEPELSVLKALPHRLTSLSLSKALASFAAAVPVAFAATIVWDAVALPILALIAAVSGVGVFGSLLDFQQPRVTAAVLAALSAFVVSCWPNDRNRSRNALVLTTANLALAWMLALYTGELHA